MNIRRIIPSFCATLAACCYVSSTQAVDFSIGGGYPFFVSPEVSIATNDENQRWFANYKLGLDDGFSVGVEHAWNDSKQHALGITIGAIGIKDNKDDCQNQDQGNLGSVLGCVIAEAFDDEVTQGLALSYGYYFQGLNEKGWRIKLELGYGEGANSNEKRVDAGLNVSYQF